MTQTAPTTMTVRVPDRRHSPVGHATIRTVTISATCPTCGGRRGEPVNHNFGDDGAYLSCDRWTNSCGHVDMYDAVLAEAEQRALVGIIIDALPPVDEDQADEPADDAEHCYHPSGVDRDDHDCVHCECCCDCLGCEYGPRDGMLLGPVELPQV